MARLFKSTFEKHSAKKKSDDKTAANALDELSLDESLRYQEKTTKYIGNSLKSCTDPVYWFMMRVTHLVRGPWLHFYRFFCIKHGSGRLHVVELVSRTVYNIRASFDDLLTDISNWTSDAVEFGAEILPYCGNEASEQLDMLSMGGVAVALLLQSAAVFDRRVIRAFHRWDLKRWVAFASIVNLVDSLKFIFIF